MRIGVDLMSVSRFARIANHPRYRAVVFTEAELAEADGLGPARYTERLAGRFCAKEATCKLLGRGFGQGLGWRDIEVTADRWGAPRVVLRGGARRVADLAGVREIALTLTHQADLVVAVTATCEPPFTPHPLEPAVESDTLTGAGAPSHATPSDRLDEIAELAADVFSVSVEEVVAARRFTNDLGTDSLLAIELLTQLEKRYAVHIPESETLRMVDLNGTYRVVAECAGW